MECMKSILVIPLYEPKTGSLDFLKSLKASTFSKVLVVDDGSGPSYKKTFDEIAELDNFEVISYPLNHGKGHALKAAFAEIEYHYPEVTRIITADGDGQHLPKDILEINEESQNHPDEIYLGARDFHSPSVPKRSRFGNRFSAYYFYLMSHKELSDTQTGLRSYPASALDTLLSTDGERYDYEMNCLFALAPLYAFKEMKIATVYEEDNKSSHFRTIRDSALIYKTPLEYLLVAISSALLDFGAYYLLNSVLSYGLFGTIAFSTVVARVFSGTYNFALLFGLVYRGRSSLQRSALRYLVLFFVNMVFSFSLVYAFSLWTGWLSILVKLLVELIIFVLDYFLTSTIVFVGKKRKGPKA